jgi:hypothetical protein
MFIILGKIRQRIEGYAHVQKLGIGVDVRGISAGSAPDSPGVWPRVAVAAGVAPGGPPPLAPARDRGETGPQTDRTGRSPPSGGAGQDREL